MTSIFQIIRKYRDSDPEYSQLLSTILSALPEDQQDAFKKLLQDAEDAGHKVIIKESELPEVWDAIDITNLQINAA